MIDLTYLESLIQTLKKHKITSYKDQGLELVFHVEQMAVPSTVTPDLAQASNIQDFPPDLRADDSMNMDKLLNWSAPPSADEQELPLTGEEAL